MRRLFAAVLLAVVATTGAAACRDRGKGSSGPVALDGTPRTPDVEGLLQQATTSRLTIDGRRYPLTRDIQVFSPVTLKSVSLSGRANQYVQAGLDRGAVVWLAVYGAVASLPGRSAPVAFHTGTLVRNADGRLVFVDGTVLRLASGVPVPKVPATVRVEIDSGRRQVTAVAAV